MCEHDIFSLIDILKEESPAEELAEVIKSGIVDDIVVH